MKKVILLIADEPKIIASIKEALGRHVDLETAADKTAAQNFLLQKKPELIIIDFDLRGQDGLQVFRELGTSIKVIMLSDSSNIPLVVAATKQGVEDFLRKPLDPRQLLDTVNRHLLREPIQLKWAEGEDWLSGGSHALQQMYDQIQTALQLDRHIILVGEKGVPVPQAANFIHANSPRRARKLMTVETADFRQEAMEGHLWATLQKLLSLPEASSLQDEADRCGTIFLEGIEQLDEHVRLSLLNFFKQQRGRTDRTIRAIIDVQQIAALPPAQTENFAIITIPPLRQRREDLPFLVELCLKRYSRFHGKKVEYIAAELLDFLVAYDYPGNYAELKKLIEEAVLAARGDKLELESFPFNFPALQSVVQARALRKNAPLGTARRAFEKDLYYILLKKAHGDTGKVARFLDLPKTALAARLENLLD
ncbi:sigma-54-dependent Fis family transcriptional regulator [Candidatus Saganbacteria bacterium]|nr:sigma-54-dependent Fis family transcriptional regulator [Candidatus Saganbacteria bacterium]